MFKQCALQLSQDSSELQDTSCSDQWYLDVLDLVFGRQLDSRHDGLLSGGLKDYCCHGLELRPPSFITPGQDSPL